MVRQLGLLGNLEEMMNGIIKSAGHTYPDADANNHGHSRGAVAERFQWVDCDIATVPTHSCQSDACGLDCYLKNSKTYT